MTGYDDAHRPRQHTETYGGRGEGPVTKNDAKGRHAAHVAAVGAGAVSTSRRTLGDYLARWLDDRAGTWSPTTERRNRTIVRQLPAALAAKPLRDLTRGDLQRYLDRLARTSAPAGVRRVHVVLSGALREAVDNEDEGLARNPAAGVRLPATVVPEATPPTDDELGRILGAAGLIGDLWRDAFTFAAFTGLRRGELAALRWADLGRDLDAVKVAHSVEASTKAATGSTWALKDTKTHQARTVPLAARARRAVIRRREAQGGRPARSAFVFSEDDGAEPVHPDRLSKQWAKAAQSAGLPDVELKDLRSYAATVLASSAGLKVAQGWLGHRDVTTTARHYAGSRADAVAAGLAALDAVGGDEAPELTA